MVSTVPVTGSIVLPDGSAFDGGTLYFTLSGPDTEDDVAVAGEYVTGLDGTDIPAGFEVWRNTAGSRGTSYQIKVLARVTLANGDIVRRPYIIGYGFVGDAESYTIADILGSGSSYTPLAGRAALVQRIADGWVPAPGMIVFGGAEAYIGVAGSTEIDDAPGLEPAGIPSPLHWGGVRDGVTDAGPAINAALAYAGGTLGDGRAGGEVYLPTGVWLFGETLLPPNLCVFKGDGKRRSVLQRYGDFGHSLLKNGGQIRIQGISFSHSIAATNQAPAAPLDDLIEGDWAHVRLENCEASEIVDCEFSRMPRLLDVIGCRRLTIRGNSFFGTWHPTDVTMQETKTSLRFGDGTLDKCALITVEDNRFEGTTGPAETITIDDGMGNSVTLPRQDEGNWGPKNHILIECIEMADFRKNYFVRASEGYVIYNASIPATPPGPNYGHTWSGNRFDGDVGAPNAASYQMKFNSRDGTVSRNITLIGNQWFGGLYCRHAIVVETDEVTNEDTGATNDNAPTVYNLQVIGNLFQTHLGAQLVLLGVKGAVISGNVITAWNAGKLPDANPMFSAGIYRGDYSQQIKISGNIIGGGGLTMVKPGVENPPGTLINYSYRGIYDENPNDYELDPTGNTDGGCVAYLHNSNLGRDIYIDGDEGWVRREPDGSMKCWHRLAMGSRKNSGAGSLASPYMTATQQWVFGGAFHEAPNIQLTAMVDTDIAAARACAVSYRSVGITAVNGILVAAVSSNATEADVYVDARADGRWKA